MSGGEAVPEDWELEHRRLGAPDGLGVSRLD